MRLGQLNTANNPPPKFLCEIPHTRYHISLVHEINDVLIKAVGEDNFRNFVKEYHQDSTVVFEVKDEYFEVAEEAVKKYL